MASIWRFARWLPAGVILVAGVLLPLSMPAQIKIGETTASANGLISSGYTANYGNMTSSNHDWTVGGMANISGSYYSPNFLSFTVAPYLNQSRANSNFQSITSASGVTASANIFAGSHFPGTISYSDAYNSEGNYAIPGLANYVTHGNAGTFGINWNENLPDLPSLSVGYQIGKSHYTVYGVDEQGNNSFRSLNLHSGYRWAGFNMGAYYTNGGSHSDIPQLATGLPTEQLHNHNDGFGFNATHLLPWQGSVSGGFNRSSWKSDYLGFTSTGTIDTVNSTASVRPTQNVTLSSSLNYSDNLSGELIQSVLGAGGLFPLINSNQTSNSFDVMGMATYTPLHNLQTSTFAEHRSQTFLGDTYAVQSYGGGASYTHKLLNGGLNGSVVMSANVADKTGEDTLGFSTNENYTTEIKGWHLNVAFGYAQDMQTQLVTYMNSYYNFSGNVNRSWGPFNVTLGGGGAHSALTQSDGASNSSQSYHAGLAYGRWVTANGSYAKSDGQAILTGTGLVPSPVPSPVLTGLISLYGGESYSMGMSSSPVRGFTVSANYARSTTSTSNDINLSSNFNNQFTSLVVYQYRKLYFTSGFSRLEQGFSLSGNKPEVISSYYMGISRWLNFF